MQPSIPSYRLSSTKSVVASGDRVFIRLRALDPDTNETLFDSEEPISFVPGQGMVLVGLERRILGSAVGETWEEVFEPQDAFGFPNPQQVVRVPEPEAPLNENIKQGSNIYLENGAVGRVLAKQDGHVVVDLNHPLAGRKVKFHVTLESIEKDDKAWSGVQVNTISTGNGQDFPSSGSTVSVHYVGTLASSGKQFDSSRARGQPFKFVVGAGLVIRGWEVGIMKLSLGERATVYVPAELGYGSSGAGGVIPPNENLVFDIELLEIDGKVPAPAHE